MLVKLNSIWTIKDTIHFNIYSVPYSYIMGTDEIFSVSDIIIVIVTEVQQHLLLTNKSGKLLMN